MISDLVLMAGAGGSSGFDLTNAACLGEGKKTKRLSLPVEECVITALNFDQSGAWLYVTFYRSSSTSQKYIRTFQLSIPFDIRTATAWAFSDFTLGSDLKGFAIKSDGSAFAYCSASTKKIVVRTLNQAFNLASGGTDVISSAVDTELSAIAASADFAHFYAFGSSGCSDVCQYSFDGSAFTFVRKNTVSCFQVVVNAAISHDGRYVYTGDSYVIRQRELSTPWDITTDSASGTISTGNGGLSTAIAFNADGTAMYGTAYARSFLSGHQIVDEVIQVDIPQYSPYSTTQFTYGVGVSGLCSLKTWLLDSRTEALGIKFKPDGTRFYVHNYVSKRVEAYEMDPQWDLRDAQYSGESGLSIVTSSRRLVDFSSGGERAYLADSSARTVVVYNLLVPWDITGISSQQTYTLPVASTLRDFCISSDESRLYILDASNLVRQYQMLTPGNILTAAYTLKTFAPDDASPKGLAFSGDGQWMFIAGEETKSVYRYQLTTAWDITTAELVQTKSVSDALAITDTLTSIDISPDGSRMFLYDGADEIIYQYQL